jgi:hypothetical protein
MSLEDVFVAFASYGTAPSRDMDNSHFAKMCKECGFIDKVFTMTDVDLIFNKVKSKGERKITFGQFQAGVIPAIAAKKKLSEEAIAEKVLQSSPQTHATKADNVKFHDDKSLYTGVYKAGGPTTVDRNSADLSAVTDRRVSNDVRGATSSTSH